MGLAVAFILAILSWVALQEIGRKVAVSNADKLQVVLDATEQAYHAWFQQQQADVSIWANTPELQVFAKSLLQVRAEVEQDSDGDSHPDHSPASYDVETEPAHIALQASPVQAELQQWLKPMLSAKSHLGYFIIALDGISLSSSRHENIGTPNLLQQQNDFLQRVWAGHAVVTLPQVSDVPLPDAQGELRSGLPTMFAAAPIYDDAGKPIAALAFRINPDRDFTRIFTQTRMSAGESLAFNRERRLISHSRYDDELRLKGLLGGDESSMLNVDLRKEWNDHGQSLQVAFYGGATNVESGEVNVEGYRNYRGERVIGAWRWLPEYSLGLAVEQEYATAYAVLNAVRGVMWALMAVVLLLIAALAYLFVGGRKQILESQSRLSGIVEMAGDAIISIDETQNVILFNAAAEKIFGYSEAEMLGRPLSCLLPAGIRKAHHQHVREFAGNQDGMIVNPARDDLLGLRKNGEKFPIEASASKQVVAGSLIYTVMLRDITQRVQAEVDLRREQDQARRYLDTVDAIMLALDTEGRVTLINRKGCEVLDIAEAEILGQNWFELAIGEADRDQARVEFKDYIRSGSRSEHHHEDVVSSDGEQHAMAWHSSLIVDEAGTVKGMLSAGLDVTDFKRSAQERDRLQRQLMQAQKVEAIGQLTGGIAHDFNNMLASICGFTELSMALEVEDPTHKLFDYLRQVHQTSLRAADLVNKLLAFSRGVESALTSQSLPELVEGSFGMLGSVLPSTIQVNKHFDADLPNVMVDATQLDQVVVNLCINARDAMDGKGSLDVGLRRVTIDNEECVSCLQSIRGEFVLLSVRDSGGGIDPEIIDKIFNPFFTSKGVGKGSGMGLSMVHGIVHSHGGHVRVRNVQGGAEFLMYFPVAAQGAPEQEKDDAIDQGINTPIEHTQRRILLVDDEKAVADMLGEVMRYAGFEVESYTDSPQALLKFKQDPSAFDLLLTDQTMPQMTGTELAQAVMSIRPEFPVVLCSGYSAEVDEDAALAMGIRAYLAKPLDTGRLMRTVDQLLGEAVNNQAKTYSSRE